MGRVKAVTIRVDETWHRLLAWTTGSEKSERLASQILHAEGYIEIDPSHPLGGKDGGKDAICSRDGKRWIMAAYFPRGQQGFDVIREKFLADLRGVAINSADGIAFVTNQELRLAERKTLTESGAPALIDIFHLERLAQVLDRPAMSGTRSQFLSIPPSNQPAYGEALKEILGHQTGGDTYAYAMLYDFDMQKSLARQFVIIRKGNFPLYDLRVRATEPPDVRDQVILNWGEISAPAEYHAVQWKLRNETYLRFFFHARNGQWHQDLVLKRSAASGCWLAATRVSDTRGLPRFEFSDADFKSLFGEAVWRE